MIGFFCFSPLYGLLEGLRYLVGWFTRSFFVFRDPLTVPNHQPSLAPTVSLLPFTISHSCGTVVVGNWPGQGSSSLYVGKGSVHNRLSPLVFVCLGR